MLALGLVGGLTLALERERRAAERTQVESLVRDHVRTVGNAVDRAMSASFALGALVQQGDGNVADFDAVATEMLEYYPSISVLALSPGGVIRQTVPFEPNQASIGFDQFADPVQGAEARLARDSRRLTLAGPLELVQGGLGIVGRLPVFLDGGGRTEPAFWGLVNVVVRMPDLLDEVGLRLLRELGLHYALWKTDPNSGDRQVIAGFGDPFPKAPAEFGVELPNGTWTLSAAPAGGWAAPRRLALELTGSLLLALLVGWVVHLLLVLRHRRASLEEEVQARTAEIRDARNQLAGTLAAIPDLLFEVDEEGVFHAFHSPRRDLLVLPPERFLGRRMDEVAPAPVVETIRNAFAQANRTGFSSGAQYRLELQGRVHWFELSVARKPTDDGAPVRYIALARDVTARKEADEALRESEARFLQAQKMETVGRLAGGVAHDFNNLLTVIRGAAEIAEESLPPDHPCRTELDQVRGAAERGAALTRQLLGYSGRRSLSPRPLDLVASVRELEELLRRLLGSDIRVEVAADTPDAWVHMDPNQLSQVLLNLASNARDAMPRGGAFRLGIERVRGPASPRVRLTVTDTGSGMPPEVLDRIFEPFFTTKDPGKGTGLGLATVFGIVRQAGGSISCASTQGEGTRFEILLPGRSAPSVAVGGAPETPAEVGPKPGSATNGGRPLLVVDDEPGILSLARRILERNGHDVMACESGEAALAWAEGEEAPPGLLLTDLVMPGVTGVELAHRIRKRWPCTPVLFTSGYADHAVLNSGELPDDSSFLPKPYALSELVEAVEEVLRDRGRANP